MVVQVYYFDIFKDISFYGFLYKGEKYKYFTFIGRDRFVRKRLCLLKNLCGMNMKKLYNVWFNYRKN